MPEAATSRRARLGVVLAAALLLLAGLGRVDAWAPDEPRYMQVAEEMRSLRHGPEGFVLLHLNGRPYDQKPPLYFWLAALAGTPGGHVSEAAARLPSALAGLGCVMLTLSLGARLFGGRVGLLGAALLLTTFEFANLARGAQLDVLLTLFETAALALFWRLDRGLGPRALQVAGLHLCLGLGVLTKGPVAILVPLLVMLAYLFWERRPRALWRAAPLWALPLSLGPGLAWLAAAAWLGPQGFAAGTLGENLIGRFFAGTSHARPFYYYLYQLPGDFMPWTLLAPALWLAARQQIFGGPAPSQAAGEERRSVTPDAAAERAAVALHGERRRAGVQRAWRFLLAWVGASVAFFSLSAGKRGLYLLPTFPALALLLADALARVLAGRTRLPRVLAGGLGLGAASALLAGAAALGFAALGPSFERTRELAAVQDRRVDRERPARHPRAAPHRDSDRGRVRDRARDLPAALPRSRREPLAAPDRRGRRRRGSRGRADRARRRPFDDRRPRLLRRAPRRPAELAREHPEVPGFRRTRLRREGAQARARGSGHARRGRGARARRPPRRGRRGSRRPGPLACGFATRRWEGADDVRFR